jgi:serine/threonine protein kinase
MFAPVRVLSDNGPVRVELARWKDRLVVVKKLKSHSPFAMERLRREAEVLRKLQHESIVPLLMTEGDSLVYAYCPGVNLADALEAGPFPLRRSLKIMHDVLAALSYAHKNNVIHFDVKPGNIIVKGERALLGDFGFAKDLGLSAITAEGTMLGTPNYMAPEQFRGERNDPRSDLYSAGAVLYHMLTGEPPYGGQIFRFLVGDKTIKLSPLPEELADIADVVYKSLDHNPMNRFQTADEMQAALEENLTPAWSY